MNGRFVASFVADLSRICSGEGEVATKPLLRSGGICCNTPSPKPICSVLLQVLSRICSTP